MADLRDLQVWHKLAWMDPDWLVNDPRLIGLVEKGRDFSEDDKHLLANSRAGAVAVHDPGLPAGARAGTGRVIDLAVLSPDPSPPVRHRRPPGRPSRRVAAAAPVPVADDAREQVARAVRFHTDLFGEAPVGLWPSEGSVSSLMVPIVAAEGLGWMATDEDVLARSLGELLPRDGDGLPLRPELLYRPYQVEAGGARVNLLFRDHSLSDRIGFHYQSWEPHHAADDFLWRVRESGRRFAERAGGEDATIVVILDGENAWEHYVGGGRPFLRELYGRLQAATDIETVTMAEAASSYAKPLPNLFPGSWIHADFYIWAGHRDDQRAWSQLSDLRAAFEKRAPFDLRGGTRSGLRGAPHCRGLGLVLVVRRRPLVGPGRRVRRSLPTPRPERLHGARSRAASRVIQDEHHYRSVGGRSRRDDQGRRVASRL